MRYSGSALVFALAVSTAQVNADVTHVAGVREVTMTDRSVVPIAARIRFFTDIVLPDPDDLIKDAACGDPDFWIIEVSDTVVRVKPAKEGSTTNLGIRTASGRIYTFLLTEGKSAPDVKVFVRNDPNQPREPPRFYPAAQVDALHSELAAARAALNEERQRRQETIAAFRAAYPSRLRFDYGAPRDKKPFYIRAIWHDGQFTYLRSGARELPALYEIVDDKPALVNFQVRDGGLYVVPKVLDRGYLVIGKKRFTFERER